MFGYSIVKTDELDCLNRVTNKTLQARRWFSGFQDLDIIWEYILEITGRGPYTIDDVRDEYAKARGTDSYGNPRDSIRAYQRNIWTWCRTTFNGIAAWNTTKERNYRFIEEACELVQASGLPKADVLKVVDYVYARPVGETEQEVGGVLVTLLALSAHLNIQAEEAIRAEYGRITEPEIQDKIRRKQQEKNEAFL